MVYLKVDVHSHDTMLNMAYTIPTSKRPFSTYKHR